MRTLALAFIVVLSITACTSVTVKSLSSTERIKHVCIEENEKVVVADFLQVLRDGFDRNGISTEVYSGKAKPSNCEYVVTYTANQNWDLRMYMYHAEVRIEKDGRYVASATYDLAGKGGLALTKYQSTKTKMDPIIDEMLTGVAAH